MKRLIEYMILLMILSMAVVLMTGCCIDDKVTGGGWFINVGEGSPTISSVRNADGGKCTFGFNAHGEGCLCDGIKFKGQFQFNDHSGTKIHAVVMDLDQVGSNTYKIEGIDKKSGEDIVVYVKDLGQPGADPGDWIKIEYDGSVWKGELGGGNIKIH